MLLTPRHLQELEQWWVSLHAPLLEYLRPGLTDAEMNGLAAGAHLRLPDEARLWWGWHDGVPAEFYGILRQLGGPSFQFLPLQEALDLYEVQRATARRAVSRGDKSEWGNPDFWWDPSWLPITESPTSNVTIACDCSVRAGDPTPIRGYFWDAAVESRTPATASFGELVEWWLQAFSTGAWFYDQELGRWEYFNERLPPAQRSTGVV